MTRRVFSLVGSIMGLVALTSVAHSASPFTIIKRAEAANKAALLKQRAAASQNIKLRSVAGSPFRNVGLNRDSLNPQPLPPGPGPGNAGTRLRAADPLNPQPLPPGPPPQSKFKPTIVAPTTALRVR